MNLYPYAAAAALGFAAGWLIQGANLSALERDHAQALAKAHAQVRLTEARWRTTIEGVQIDAREQLAQVADDAATAAATADGLRRELDRIRRRAASCTAAADGSAPRRDAELLAELLAEVESAGRAMAAEADRRGVAGAACERAYHGVSGGGR